MMRYFDEMREVLESHGGVVEKYIGDAVMAVFGLPVVREDDALRAVAAADGMRGARAPERRARGRWGVRLTSRIGVNTGEVVAGNPAEEGTSSSGTRSTSPPGSNRRRMGWRS